MELSPFLTAAHWKKKIEELRAKLALGEEIIRRKDRPSKLKTIYKQVVAILDSQLQFEIRERTARYRDPLIATTYRNSAQKELNTYRKQVDSVWLPYILNDEITRMSREYRSIDPNAPQMALTHNVSSNISDLSQNNDQSSSSSNNRELLDVSNTELSESFLLKKKQEEETQRLNYESIEQDTSENGKSSKSKLRSLKRSDWTRRSKRKNSMRCGANEFLQAQLPQPPVTRRAVQKSVKRMALCCQMKT